MTKQCAGCGNEYDKMIRVTCDGRTEFFDCFECAIHVFAPECMACGMKIIGHGVEMDGDIFCSAHCARMQGKLGLTDRQPAPSLYMDSEF